MSTISPPLKWHGGKQYLAKRIIELMPPHIHYVEPYFGGGAVLLETNPEGVSEVVNDINGELMNFWGVLAHPASFSRLNRGLEATPFSEELFNSIMPNPTDDEIQRAWKFFVLCRQSRAGTFKEFAPISRNRTRRGKNEQASAWQTAIEGLPAVHARLWGVVLLNNDALDVIRKQDGPRTLFYCDPPYLHETRTAPDVYQHEMSEEQHAELLRVLCGIRGKAMLSGYRSELYDAELKGWTRYDFDLPNNAAGGKEKRRMTECVWCNFCEVMGVEQ